jgi:hypothetical protein
LTVQITDAGKIAHQIEKWDVCDVSIARKCYFVDLTGVIVDNGSTAAIAGENTPHLGPYFRFFPKAIPIQGIATTRAWKHRNDAGMNDDRPLAS